MTNGEIISLIAVVLSFLALCATIYFSSRKASKEDSEEQKQNIADITTIKNDISSVKNSVIDIKFNIKEINEKMDKDHDKIIEHETKITKLEKEVFAK